MLTVPSVVEVTGLTPSTTVPAKGLHAPATPALSDALSKLTLMAENPVDVTTTAHEVHALVLLSYVPNLTDVKSVAF
jgi:hypothetical protein